MISKRAIPLAHKAFEISWITECWQHAITLLQATTLSLFPGTGLQQLLLDKAAITCTLHALNKERLDLEGKTVVYHNLQKCIYVHG